MDWVYDFLPLIDEHNKQRQNILGLEMKWPTKCCWFRLLVTLVGMSVVDLYRIYLNHDKETYEKMTILDFSEEMCLNLRERMERSVTFRMLSQDAARIGDAEMRLERLIDVDGNITREPSLTMQTKHKWISGSAITSNCFICHKYVMTEGETNYMKMCFCCIDCKMPLCLADRHSTKREMTCYQEHKSSTDLDIGCTSACKKGRIFPKTKQIFIGNDNENVEQM